MGFTTYTTCPCCGILTPMLKREQTGKVIRETCSCPVHGFIFWSVVEGCRKLLGFGQGVPPVRQDKRGSFMDRCEKWSELRFGDTPARIRRIPPKKR